MVNVGIVDNAGVNVCDVPVAVGHVIAFVFENVPPLIPGAVIFVLAACPRVLATVHSVYASTRYFLPADAAASSVTP